MATQQEFIYVFLMQTLTLSLVIQKILPAQILEISEFIHTMIYG